MFIDAAKWARSNDGVAIYVSLGSDSGLDPTDLERNFEGGFAKHFGVNAKAFVEQQDDPGSSVMYYIGETVTEPEPYQTATTPERISQIVAQYGAHRSFFGHDRLPASFRASSWARENEGIGIAVVLGAETGLRPEALAKNFKDGFKEQFSIVAEVFIDKVDRPGAIISYYYGEHATNPEPFQTGTKTERMEEIVAMHRAQLEYSK